MSYPVDDGPHNDAWKELLPPCFRVIDEVVRERKVEFPIRIGGGSMLLRRYTLVFVPSPLWGEGCSDSQQ